MSKKSNQSLFQREEQPRIKINEEIIDRGPIRIKKVNFNRARDKKIKEVKTAGVRVKAIPARQIKNGGLYDLIKAFQRGE